jgi:hypothetical protein
MLKQCTKSSLTLHSQFSILSPSQKFKQLELIKSKLTNADDDDSPIISNETFECTKSMFGDSTTNSTIRSEQNDRISYTKDTVIKCFTNNLGKCSILINPLYFISQYKYINLRDDAFCSFTSVYVANSDDEDFSNWSLLTPIPINNIIPHPILSYMPESVELFINEDKVTVQNEDEDQEDISKGKYQIKTLNQRVINTCFQMNYANLHRFNLPLVLQGDTPIYSNYTMSTNEGSLYGLLPKNTEGTQAVIDGYSISNSLPMFMIDNKDHPANIVIDNFIDKISTSSEPIENISLNMSCVNFYKRIMEQEEAQAEAFQNGNLQNENCIRIDYYGEPYSTFDIRIQVKLTCTIAPTSNQLYKNLLLPKKTINMYSNYEKMAASFARMLKQFTINKNKDYIRRQVYGNYSQGINGSFWDKLKNFGSAVFSTAKKVLPYMKTGIDAAMALTGLVTGTNDGITLEDLENYI